MTTTNIYPGMVSNDYEFFNHANELKVLTSGVTSTFDKLPAVILDAISEVLAQDFKAAAVIKSGALPVKGSALEVFTRCRLGGLDFTPDVQVSDCATQITIQNGEYWDCPMRGKCAGEGIVCRMPEYNGERLSIIEVQIMKELHTVDTNEAIAERLGIPMGTYHFHKKHLYRKLGNLQTRHEVTRVADSLNIR